MVGIGDRAIGFWQINLTTNNECHMFAENLVLQLDL